MKNLFTYSLLSVSVAVTSIAQRTALIYSRDLRFHSFTSALDAVG